MSVSDCPYSNVAALWASETCRKLTSSVPVQHLSGWGLRCWHGRPFFLSIGRQVPASMCGIPLSIRAGQIHAGQAESIGRCRPREAVRPCKAGRDGTLRSEWNRCSGSHLYPSRRYLPHELPCRACSVHVSRWGGILCWFRLMGEIRFLPSVGCSGSHSWPAKRSLPAPSGRRNHWRAAASLRA